MVGFYRGVAAVAVAVLVLGVTVGLATDADKLLDPTADVNVVEAEPGDADTERTPGVTVASLAVNGTPYDMTDVGNRTVVEPGAFEVDRANRTIDAPDHVETEAADGAFLLEASEGTRLVVAEDEYLQVAVPDHDGSTAGIGIYLMDPRTEVLPASGDCEVSMTSDGEQGNAGVALLSEPGSQARVAIEPADPCQEGTVLVTHRGTDWSWA